MQICTKCGRSFAKSVEIAGKQLNVRGRLQCLECKPHRPLRGPRKRVVRATRAKTCESCGGQFQAKLVVGERIRSLYRRRFCLECSPFGMHNTAKSPPGAMPPAALIEFRRRRRNAKTYRYQKKKRTALKRS